MQNKIHTQRMANLDEVLQWQTDKRLLPGYMRASDNSREIRHYKIAAQKAINTQLSRGQREQLLLYYGEGLNKTQIARRFGVGSSTVCKAIKAAEKIVKEYVEMYMQIYDALEREYLEDEERFGG